MTSILVPPAKYFDAAQTKYPQDLKEVYESNQETLVTLVVKDAKGTYGQINGKKTYLLTQEKLKDALENIYSKSAISMITTAMTVNIIIVTSMFAALVVVGLTLATLAIYIGARYILHQKSMTEQACLWVKIFVGTGHIPNFTPLNSQDNIPIFRYNPSPEARTLYGPMTALIQAGKTNPDIERYIAAHRNKNADKLPHALSPDQILKIEEMQRKARNAQIPSEANHVKES